MTKRPIPRLCGEDSLLESGRRGVGPEEIRMVRVDVIKKKKSSLTTELNRLKKELKRATELLAARERELGEAVEHQTATSEVLSIISRSPTDVQPVLDAIVESAARVCGIDDVVLRLREGNTMVMRAHFGPLLVRTGRDISLDEAQARWVGEHGTLHIADVREQNDFPMLASASDLRTFLVVPFRQ